MKYLKLYLVTLIIIFSIINNANAQVLISSGTGTPDPSAMLEVRSTTQGILIPRMTSAERTLISAAEGLLVYDTDFDAFFLRGSIAWINLSSSAEIWTRSESNVFLTNNTDNIGIGTSSPTSKFVVQADAGDAPEAVLFEVKDEIGNPIFKVTSEGVRIFVKDETTTKGISGGFAVGRYGTAKGFPDTTYFAVTPFSTEINTKDPAGKGVSGGFAVGRYGTAKAPPSITFSTTPDETRVYTTDVPAGKGVSGGFAVGRYGTAKGPLDNYMHITKDNYFIGHSAGAATTLPLGVHNIFLGYESGLTNTEGHENTFVGHNTGYSNTIGKDNVFLGNKAGYYNTGTGGGISGSQNVFLGYEAGYNNTTGADNVMIGWLAGHENTTAGSNIAIGSKAGYSNTTSIHNVFIGEFAGEYHKSGESNIYMGFQSGQGPNDVNGGTGEKNVFIGLQTGAVNTSGSANVYIGNQSGFKNTTGLNNVFIGNEAGLENTIGDYNVFMGYRSGNNNLYGRYNVFIGNNAGYNNLGTEPLGDVFGNKNVFLGFDAGFSNTTGFSNVFLGTEAGYTNSDGFYNVFIGFESGKFNLGGDMNTFLGVQSGKNNISGYGNTFIGEQSGQASTTANENVYIGRYAGTNNNGSGNTFMGTNSGSFSKSAFSNTFIGINAGQYHETGYYNVIIGYNAGSGEYQNPTASVSNVIIGNEAAMYSKEMNSNVIIGYEAMKGDYNGGTPNYAEGDYNTVLGYRAGFSNLTGASNVFIGNQAGYSETGSDKLYIDNSSTSTPLIYGDFSANTLHINGTLSFNEGGGNIVTLPLGRGTTGQVLVSTDNAGNTGWASTANLDNDWTVSGNDMYSGVTGNVGIGTGSPAYKLHVESDNGAIYGFTDGTGAVVLGVYGNSIGTGANKLGVYGVASGLNTNYGVYGYAWGGTTNWAGFFDGNLYASGNVGIGRVPIEKLEVLGDAVIGSGSSGYDGSSEHVRIDGRLDSWYLGVRNETTVGQTDFFIGQSDLEDAIFHIQNDGDVGIGTYPIYQLHVVDNTITSDNPAIYGIHAVTDYYGVGVKGEGRYMGVSGYASSPSGIIYGVYGLAEGAGTGTRYGVYGIASGGTTAYAGYFEGNVHVTGTLSKTAGSFKIDHPTDPENKYLVHSFVESPDMMNIYNGNVILNGNGEAIVKLPDYFEALNMEFRYQLTAVGAPGPNLYIAEEISGNTFKIAGGTSGMKVSWQVTGIRQDPYAEKYRIEVEVDKRADERGKYLHPDVYDQPKEKGIDYEHIKSANK